MWEKLSVLSSPWKKDEDARKARPFSLIPQVYQIFQEAIMK
jgi:hypothetical protein